MTDSNSPSTSDRDEFILELLNFIRCELTVKLTGIKGYSEIIERVGPLTDKQKEFLGLALKYVGEAQKTLDGIYDEVETDLRIQFGKLETRIETLDLSTCVDEVVIALQPEKDSTKQKMIRIRLPNLPLVQVRKQELIVVLKGLLNSAFIPFEDIILIAEKIEDFIKVTVAGISFGSVFREEVSVKERIHAIGLIEEKAYIGLFSLSYSKNLIEGWGGEIGYIDNDEEAGAFWFTLPIAE